MRRTSGLAGGESMALRGLAKPANCGQYWRAFQTLFVAQATGWSVSIAPYQCCKYGLNAEDRTLHGYLDVKLGLRSNLVANFTVNTTISPTPT
jgi:hypothetical protein